MNSHRDNNTLMLFLFEEMPTNELQAVKKHVCGCEACRSELTLLQEALDLYGQLSLEVPPREALSSVRVQRTEEVSESERYPAFELLSIEQPRRWAMVAVIGILLVAGTFYVSRLTVPSKSAGTGNDISWESPLGYSLSDISGRISSLREEPTFPVATAAKAGALFATMPTIERDISNLKERIEYFSTSLSSTTF